VPLEPGRPRESTLEAWHQQGLPEGADWHDHLMQILGIRLHSMISPAMTRRFLLPTWDSWVQTIKASSCPIVGVDSDGYMAELMPIWIEAGFNCCFPVEVAAGNDIVAYRRQYGRQMAYVGGIDKRALAAGGAKMRAEVMRVVPPLFEAGGFIPGCDHGVPPDISWPTYVAYTRLLAELSGWRMENGEWRIENGEWRIEK
jgi:hypothetical protein